MRAWFALLLLAAPLQAQYLGRPPGVLGAGRQAEIAPGFGMAFEEPVVHRYYAPRQLVDSYLRPWYAGEGGYARDLYRRYVDVSLEGEEWYDSFGTPLGRGWLVYSWTQQQQAPLGSQILKGPADPSRVRAYDRFFDRLVIAADGSGQSSMRLMIGDEIYTSFTPLTFYKPRFNGMRLDYASQWYQTSLLLSRPSEPNRGGFSDATHLIGGHAEFQLRPLMKMGLTYVNAHNAQTKEEFTAGNPLRGTLTTQQNQVPETIYVQVRDDSPSDGASGAALFAYDIVLEDTSGLQVRGSQLGFLPLVEGGRAQGSTLVAQGAEAILLRYDLDRLEGLRASQLRRAIVELSLADDYRVEMSSNLQTDGQSRPPSPVFLTFRRAAGNVRDRSNGTVLQLDYALPTGNELIGANWDLVDWAGLSVQGELVLNRRYGQYPSPDAPDPHQAVTRASAAYALAAYRRLPWSWYLEMHSIDDAYATNYWLTQSNGQIKYRDLVPQFYEFVEDDDDHNALPDWERPFQRWNPVAWPGYDENADFRHDHNENNNLIPDYEEPFLRFRADRPEFLFGLDMNHNGVIDRFENDESADYPYRRDQRGYNTYTQVQAGPELKLSAGHQRARLLAGEGHTRAWYLLGAWTRLLPHSGRLRAFAHGALVRDDIADDLVEWVQVPGSLGRLRARPDPLPQRDAWTHTLYADLEHQLWGRLHLLHRAKWEWLYQREPGDVVRAGEGRKQAGFLGFIDKAEWGIPIGMAILEPRWKSEFRRERPFSARQPARTVLEQTGYLLWTQPLLAEKVGVTYFPGYGRQMFNTEIQAGLEFGWRWALAGGEPDSRNWAGVLQFSDRVAYQGYKLVARAGLRVGQEHAQGQPYRRTSLFLLSVNAGL
ncbi:MAG: hypothetical protein FJY95_21405 [Candidatus Handelsmanbacteria bacterium]|nr:hypothetical protein [Candidatus Handelsmanbacteria bacterium]